MVILGVVVVLILVPFIAFAYLVAIFTPPVLAYWLIWGFKDPANFSGNDGLVFPITWLIIFFLRKLFIVIREVRGFRRFILSDGGQLPVEGRSEWAVMWRGATYDLPCFVPCGGTIISSRASFKCYNNWAFAKIKRLCKEINPNFMETEAPQVLEA